MKTRYRVYNNSSVLLQDVMIPWKLPEEFEFEGNKLYVKDEFHITLLSARYLAEIIDPANVEVVKDQLVSEFEEFVGSQPLDQYEITDEFRYVENNHQRGIVVMASVPKLEKLFDHLDKIFSLNLPRQQPHVTLYRYPKDFIGITIPSYDELQTKTKIIDLSSDIKL